jgi:hypothetical protein
MARSTVPLLAALVAATVSALVTLGLGSAPLRLSPGTSPWSRLVVGVPEDGVLQGGAAILLPGLDRGASSRLLVRGTALDGGAATLGVALDRGPLRWSRLPAARPSIWAVPAAGSPGLRVDLRAPDASGPVRIQSVTLQRSSAGPRGRAVFVFATVLVLTLLLARLPMGLGLALGLFAGACLGLFSTPLLALLTLEDPGVWPRLVAPVAAMALGLWAAARSSELRRFGFGATLIAAAVFGGFVRYYFLPSAGSWDVEYWKASALRGSSRGVTRVYGDPETVPAGHFLAQLRGEEPQWQLSALGQSFVIDQPPGIQALWTASWWVVSRLRGRMDYSEALNVAAKLPATLGDALAVAVLLMAFRDRLRLGALLAAGYWALPISWLSSAVLGFFDGAPAAVAVLALVLAGRGRAGWAGAVLALAALVKATALLLAPAVLAALWATRARWWRAVGAGAAVVGVALVPFAVDGTLGPAIVHVYRIIFQERLSGGFANPWWVAGAWSAAREGSFAWSERVPFVRIEALAFPARLVGASAMALLVAWVVWAARRHTGSRPAALAGFTLVFGYAMLAIGVHENHPHMLVLCLLATGLLSRRLRVVALLVLSTYTLNMLALSGLGRFYGPRYMGILPLVAAVERLRLGLGFDVTLALALVNVVVLAMLIPALPSELLGLSEGPSTIDIRPAPPRSASGDSGC